MQIFGAQRAVSLTQTQATDQHVVTRFGQVAFGLEQLALGVQHVNVDAHANLVTQAVGFQSDLTGLLSSLEGFDLTLTGNHAKNAVRVACATLRRAPSKSLLALSLKDRVSRMRFCVEKPANSGTFRLRPMVAVLVLNVATEVAVPLGLRVML